jgi:tRNA-dihydrouridine synthase
LGQPETALEVIRRTRDSVPDGIPVTVKMRRGVDDTQESRDNFFKILDGAYAIGIDGITVHGRTVVQRYIGPSRWEFLKEVKQHIGDRILLGSGDLFTAQDCLDMIAQTGVDGVTVARGAIGNPWIFGQAKALSEGKPLPDPPSLLEQKEILLEHFSLAQSLYGPDRVGKLMRKFGIKYAILHPDFQGVRSAFVKVKNLEQWKAALDQYYAEDLPGCHPDGKMHKASGSGNS